MLLLFSKTITKTSNMSITLKITIKNIFNQTLSHKFEPQTMAFHHLKKNIKHSISPLIFSNYAHKTIHKCKTLI